MADIEINNVRTVQNVDYITGTLANGDLVKIKKSDLVELIKNSIPTFGYTTCYPDMKRWKRILNMNITGEKFLSFLYSGGSFTDAESCCFIVNIIKGSRSGVVSTRISGNASIGGVAFVYKFSDDNLKIWISGAYTAMGSALINLSSEQLHFEMLQEDPPSDAIAT